MKDQELNLFFKKVAKVNIYFKVKWILEFGFKVFFDFINRKVKKRKQAVIVIPHIEKKEFFNFTPLPFVNPYTSIVGDYYLHFSNNTEKDREDEQYHHYKARFYELLFVNENEINENLDVVKNWIVNNPMANAINWHPYAVSERITNWCIFLTRFSEKLNESDKQVLLKSLYEQSEFLYNNFEHHLGHHNHLLNNSRALLYSSLVFNKESFTSKWKSKAFKVVKDEMNNQVLDDGGHSEQSSTYHLLITRTLWELRELYLELDEVFIYEELLSKMVFYSKWLVRDNNTIPFLGHITPDFHWKELVGLLNLWIEDTTINPSRYSQLFKPRYCIKKDKLISSESTVVFSDIGLGVLKNNGQEIYLSNNPKCSIATHGDQNMLGLDIIWDGTTIIRDAGLDSYDLNYNRIWFDSWQGQSCCTLNNTNPIVIPWRKAQLPHSYFKASAEIVITEKDSLKAKHSCFERLLNSSVISREVSVTTEKIFISDTVLSNGANSYTALFHFGDNEIELDKNRIIINDRKQNSTFSMVFPERVTITLEHFPYATAYGEKETGNSIFVVCEVNKEEIFMYSIEKV